MAPSAACCSIVACTFSRGCGRPMSRTSRRSPRWRMVIELTPSEQIAKVAAIRDNCCNLSQWQRAYERFETPEQEVRKFERRLRWFGAHAWPRSWHIADLFCGRGNNLVALERLGFRNLTGVDLSS